MHKITIYLAITFLFAKICYCRKYTNYTLYRGIPVNEQHLEFFTNLSEQYDVNFWRQPSTIYRPVEFILPPEQKLEFTAKARAEGIYLTTIIGNIQSAFDQQTVKNYVRRNMASFDWQSYFRLKDIYSWLKDLSNRHSDEMTLFSLGKTYENRNIMGAKIVLKENPKKRSIAIIEGGIHAREWISPAFVTYMLAQILNAPRSKDKELLKIASTYEWYFVPVINPDGYEYSHTEDRIWRKNREKGHGVDINRNFAHGFGTVGVSHNKHSDIYCGPSAFSERESRAMGELIKSKSDKLEYYVGFHSYGQFMIIPYAHSTQHSENFDEVKAMGLEATKEIYRLYGTKYTVGTAYDTVGYKTSGVSGCWVKKTFKVPYVMIMELRDTGQFGFALPTNQILPTCQETMPGLISFFKPRTNSFGKLKLYHKYKGNGQENITLNEFVFICGVVIYYIKFLLIF